LIEGDIVSLDFGVKHKGMITDAAITVPVGDIPARTQELIDLTRGALYAGIDVMKAGNRIGDIGAAIEAHVKPHRLGLIRDLGGHGVGHAVHEEPFVPNFGTRGTGSMLTPGMVLAIEPMFTLGSPAVVVEEDGYTIRSADRSLSAHFEHTVIITSDGPEVVTEFES
jgi:methionyl aminopeptidase